jgi:hypothetical protein
MYEPNCNDYVLITDSKDECYLQIGKIVEIINEPFGDYVSTYIIEFYDFRYSIKYRRAYKGSIFEDYTAKVLNFKR